VTGNNKEKKKAAENAQGGRRGGILSDEKIMWAQE